MVANQLLNRDTGAALAYALLVSQQWKFRRVESLRLLAGPSARRRVSLDLMPPPDVALAYYAAERRSASIDEVRGSVMVPLTLMQKGALRNFDVRSAAGEAIPVLGRQENADLGVAIVLSEIDRPDAFQDPSLERAVRAVVDAPPADALAAYFELTRHGRHGGLTVLAPSELSEFGDQLLRDFCDNYLMVGLFPASSAGERLVVKYAFHWDLADWGKDVGLIREWGAAAGYAPARLAVGLGDPADSASYHLEVHPPDDLLVAAIGLPGIEQSDVLSDDRPGAIAHAVGTYSLPPFGDAWVDLKVPGGGLRFVASLVVLFTLAAFWLERLLPGGHKAMLDASDGAGTILLAAPAVVLALLARPSENVITSRLLRPVRILVLACSLLLVTGAATLVGYLHEPFMAIYWWGGAVVTLMMAVYLICGYVVGAVRNTPQGGDGNG
jgi:hypothetical protein